jgi:hypothetical protein
MQCGMITVLTWTVLGVYLFICNLFSAAIADILSLYVEHVWRRLYKICWTLCDVCLLQPSFRKVALLSKVILYRQIFYFIFWGKSWRLGSMPRPLDYKFITPKHRLCFHMAVIYLAGNLRGIVWNTSGSGGVMTCFNSCRLVYFVCWFLMACCFSQSLPRRLR